MGLPQPIANNVLQQHVNAAFGSAALAISQQPAVATVPKPIVQGDGAADSSGDEVDQPGCSGVVKQPKSKRKRLPQMVLCLKQNDGSNDTSDEDDDASDDEDDSDDAEEDRDEDEQEMEDAGPEEEPLNSEDDVTDEDPADLFDTENVVVCQYDKVGLGCEVLILCS